MTMKIQADRSLDCIGMACPMPIVKTKKVMDELHAGQVIEVLATDKGSLADIQGWSKKIGHHYLGTMQQGDVLKHYVRKSSPIETNKDTTYLNTISNDVLQKKLEIDIDVRIIDVREPAEYAFNRIPGAISIPLGELERRIDELNVNHEYLIVCRTGARSDLACHMLSNKGFMFIYNIIPGMSAWTGPTEKDKF